MRSWAVELPSTDIRTSQGLYPYSSRVPLTAMPCTPALSRASGVRRRRTHTSDMLREVGGDRDLLHQAALDTPCAVSKALARRCCYPGLLQTTPMVSAASVSASQPVRECIRKPATHGMRVAGVRAYQGSGVQGVPHPMCLRRPRRRTALSPPCAPCPYGEGNKFANETAPGHMCFFLSRQLARNATRQNSRELRGRHPRVAAACTCTWCGGQYAAS